MLLSFLINQFSANIFNLMVYRMRIEGQVDGIKLETSGVW